MYFRGANNDTSIPFRNSWSKNAPDFYRGSMNRTLFLLWNKILRFDDRSEREVALSFDTFAAFRIWGACPLDLRQQISLLPERWPTLQATLNVVTQQKFIKRKTLRNYYIVVMNLSEPFLDSRRNVTVECFFGSQEVAEQLLLKKHKNTYMSEHFIRTSVYFPSTWSTLVKRTANWIAIIFRRTIFFCKTNLLYNRIKFEVTRNFLCCLPCIMIKKSKITKSIKATFNFSIMKLKAESMFATKCVSCTLCGRQYGDGLKSISKTWCGWCEHFLPVLPK